MPAPVRTRKVFYIPGFDPMPPRRYRELYRTESQKQSAICAYEMTQHKGDDGLSWKTESEINGQRTATDFSVLYWSDIVQDSMKAGIFRTYLMLVRTAWIYIASGALIKLAQLRKGPVITALYPVAMLVAQLVLAILVGWFIADLLGGIVGVIFGGGVAIGLLEAFRRFDRRLFVYYLMQDYAFTARLRGQYPDTLDKRIGEFRVKIGEALAEDFDEVLVVGHSSGAHLAISTLADLLRANNSPPCKPKLSLLSLGQAVPMVSFLPDAQRLRGDLAFLSVCDAITWVDVSAPGDGACFALCDPVAVSGVAPANQVWPLVISAAFSNTLSDATLARLKWRFFKLHFQYLCAFDFPDAYDYFQITAGPVTLAERFSARNSSANRIVAPMSSYSSVAQ